MQKTTRSIVGSMILVAVLAVVFFYVGRVQVPGSMVSTMASPSIDSSLWKTSIDGKQGISFQYPDHLLTQYMHSVAWPPVVAVVAGPLRCAEGGSDIMTGGRISNVTIGGRIYCLTKSSEGAAGSIYTSYVYRTLLDPSGSAQSGGKVVVVAFSIQAVQCVNYDQPKMTECQTERDAFSIDGIINRIVQTVKVK